MGKVNHRQQWSRLKDQLNEIGPVRDVIQWQRVWTDLKFRTNKKASSIKTQRAKTGNVPVNEELTEIEIKVLGMTGSASAVGHDAEESMVTAETPVMILPPTAILPDTATGVNYDGDTYEIVEALDGEETALLHDVLENAFDVAKLEPPQEFLSTEGERGIRSSSSSPEPRTTTTSRAVIAATARAMTAPSTSHPQQVPPRAGARGHFSRNIRDQRRIREETAARASDRFAEIQERQLALQEMQVKANIEYNAARLALDRERLEQDKVNAAALTAMSAAIQLLTRAIDKNSSRDVQAP